MKITTDATAVWLWTTPEQLRDLADKMERHQSQATLGDSMIVETLTSKQGGTLHVAIDQD